MMKQIIAVHIQNDTVETRSTCSEAYSRCTSCNVGIADFSFNLDIDLMSCNENDLKIINKQSHKGVNKLINGSSNNFICA